MNWLYYLLEANLYLLIFYSFYRLLLHRETFYTLNRYFLILSTGASFLLPLLQVGYFNAAHKVLGIKLESAHVTGTAITASSQFFSLSLAHLLPLIYTLIAALFFAKLLAGLVRLYKLAVNSTRERSGPVTFFTLKGNDEIAFSFFNMLFINPQMAEKQTVIRHELAHIEQRHSLDIVFFEIVHILCWFNPAIRFLKSDIKLLHEYLADEYATSFAADKHTYALFLIRNSFGLPQNDLTNPIFNQSILKRRINMLNKKRTAARARLRLLLVLPLAGAMICTGTMAFTKDYGVIDLYPEKYSVQQEPPVKSVKKFPPPVVKRDTIKPRAKQKLKKFTPPVVIPDHPALPPKSGKKFTPPVVIPDHPALPPKSGKKFTPPVVIPDHPALPPKSGKKFTPPVVIPDKKRVKFTPPMIKGDPVNPAPPPAESKKENN